MDSSVIGILSTGFWICLSFAVLFLIISVVLFFIFDIRTIFSIKTGRAQAKTVKAMKAANESTGRLRVDGKTQTSKLSESEKDTPRAPAVIPPPESMQSTYYDKGAAETEVLQPSADEPAASQSEYAETSVLSEVTQDTYGDSEELAQAAGMIHFYVSKKLVLIHTEEKI